MGEENERERNLQRSYPSLQMTCILIGCMCELYTLQLLERQQTVNCTAVCENNKVK